MGKFFTLIVPTSMNGFQSKILQIIEIFSIPLRLCASARGYLQRMLRLVDGRVKIQMCEKYLNDKNVAILCVVKKQKLIETTISDFYVFT